MPREHSRGRPRRGRAFSRTLLLDEIGDMPLLLQGKLLRVLQEGEIRRVGSTSVRRVDVRILASTNRSLPALIQEGKFREDLFYRLNVIPVVIPPLRERPEDVVPLCRHFLTAFGQKLERAPQSLSPEALQSVLEHSWPGNVRELENVIERVVTLSSSPLISAEEFQTIFTLGHAAPHPTSPPASAGGTLQGAEKETIVRALRDADGNQTRAAEALGMGRNTLWRKMKKYGIESRTTNGPSVP